LPDSPVREARKGVLKAGNLAVAVLVLAVDLVLAADLVAGVELGQVAGAVPVQVAVDPVAVAAAVLVAAVLVAAVLVAGAVVVAEAAFRSWSSQIQYSRLSRCPCLLLNRQQVDAGDKQVVAKAPKVAAVAVAVARAPKVAAVAVAVAKALKVAAVAVAVARAPKVAAVAVVVAKAPKVAAAVVVARAVVSGAGFQARVETLVAIPLPVEELAAMVPSLPRHDNGPPRVSKR
jgi:hypothetical protein